MYDIYNDQFPSSSHSSNDTHWQKSRSGCRAWKQNGQEWVFILLKLSFYLRPFVLLSFADQTAVWWKTAFRLSSKHKNKGICSAGQTRWQWERQREMWVKVSHWAGMTHCWRSLCVLNLLNQIKNEWRALPLKTYNQHFKFRFLTNSKIFFPHLFCLSIHFWSDLPSF